MQNWRRMSVLSAAVGVRGGPSCARWLLLCECHGRAPSSCAAALAGVASTGPRGHPWPLWCPSPRLSKPASPPPVCLREEAVSGSGDLRFAPLGPGTVQGPRWWEHLS